MYPFYAQAIASRDRGKKSQKRGSVRLSLSSSLSLPLSLSLSLSLSLISGVRAHKNADGPCPGAHRQCCDILPPPPSCASRFATSAAAGSSQRKSTIISRISIPPCPSPAYSQATERQCPWSTYQRPPSFLLCPLSAQVRRTCWRAACAQPNQRSEIAASAGLAPNESARGSCRWRLQLFGRSCAEVPFLKINYGLESFLRWCYGRGQPRTTPGICNRTEKEALAKREERRRKSLGSC